MLIRYHFAQINNSMESVLFLTTQELGCYKVPFVVSFFGTLLDEWTDTSVKCNLEVDMSWSVSLYVTILYLRFGTGIELPCFGNDMIYVSSFKRELIFTAHICDAREQWVIMISTEQYLAKRHLGLEPLSGQNSLILLLNQVMGSEMFFAWVSHVYIG